MHGPTGRGLIDTQQRGGIVTSETHLPRGQQQPARFEGDRNLAVSLVSEVKGESDVLRGEIERH